MTPDLTTYDVVLVNTSGGKDSQAMLDYVVRLATEQGVRERVVAVHCDLGRVEWKGTRELAERQVAHYGLRFEVVSRPQGDLLQHVEKRGMWPGMGSTRYCTSDHKRGQVLTLVTRLVNEAGGLGTQARRERRKVRVLNCMGMRAQESAARSKLTPFKRNDRKGVCNGKREVFDWLPIFEWTVGQVWDRIRTSGVPHHPAYDLGMPRLSCVFCIFAPKAALILAGKHNRALLGEYVAVEKRINHRFKQELSLAEVAEAVDAGVEPGPINTWGQQ